MDCARKNKMEISVSGRLNSVLYGPKIRSQEIRPRTIHHLILRLLEYIAKSTALMHSPESDKAINA